jgi:DNA polymerase (family 10)
MDNYVIAENFSLLSKLMDIHGDDSFRAKSYSIAAFTIEKLETELAEMQPQEIFSIKGIGDRMGKKIVEVLNTGKLQALDDYIQKTPMGVIQMLEIKGLGPKKIATIWKELEIENLGELLYACNENRLTLYKGFGEKTQEKIKQSIEFYMSTLGSYLYSQIESYALELDKKLQKEFPKEQSGLTGEFRRQLEVITKLDWVTTAKAEDLKTFFGENYTVEKEEGSYISFRGPENVELGFYLMDTKSFCKKLFETSCSEDFLNCWKEKFTGYKTAEYECEDDIFGKNNLSVIPTYYRENKISINNAGSGKAFNIIQPEDIKGIIHSHSKWSDGVDTIEAMAKAAQKQGKEYLVISDHSKTAAYAQGLTEDKVKAQHEQIDELNEKLKPFRIFKSIESDILGDGSLDYTNDILKTFDLVIASVHSNLYMNEEKAMIRLMKAIENPYTSILGHMTGRLLLSRNGYPVNYKIIFEACAANNVVIELNANPRRLDMDWRQIDYALEKGVLISIDPDAHSVNGFDDTRYGVLAAQKAGLPKEKNLSSFSLKEFEEWLKGQHSKRS